MNDSPRPQGPDKDQSDVEKILRDSNHGPPSKVFRSRLKSHFLESSSRLSQSRARGGSRREAVQHAEIEALLVTTLRAPRAEGGFRAGLRTSFLEQVLQEGTPVVARPARSGRSGAGTSVSRSTGGGAPASTGAQPAPGRGKLYRIGVVVAAAAAAILVTFLLPADPRWEIDSIVKRASADGVAPLDAEALERDLHLGQRIETGTSHLNLGLGDFLRVRVMPDSQIEFRPLPEMGTSQQLTFGLLRGEMFLETLPGYPGNPILIDTEDAKVHVLGTALGVLVDDAGTCTCVEHGEVFVERLHRADPAPSGAQVAGTPDDDPPQRPSRNEKVKERSAFQVPRDASMGPKTFLFDKMTDPKEVMHAQALVDFAAEG